MGILKTLFPGLLLAAITIGVSTTGMARAGVYSHQIYGTYQGTCITHYKDAAPGRCPATLYVDQYEVSVPGDGGCLSPTPFFGRLYGHTADLRSSGWQAQPRGQTLELNFRQQGDSWTVSGSGNGISDRNYWYNCSFRKW